MYMPVKEFWVQLLFDFNWHVSDLYLTLSDMCQTSIRFYLIFVQLCPILSNMCLIRRDQGSTGRRESRDVLSDVFKCLLHPQTDVMSVWKHWHRIFFFVHTSSSFQSSSCVSSSKLNHNSNFASKSFSVLALQYPPPENKSTGNFFCISLSPSGVTAVNISYYNNCQYINKCVCLHMLHVKKRNPK